MSTVAAPAPQVVESTETRLITEHAVVLHEVPWETYIQLRESDLNNHLRMTYDCGDLEIMSPSGKHAKVSTVIGLMIYEWTMLHDIEVSFGGHMTLKRRDMTGGLEADQCYWIANEALVRGKDEIDLLVDPPPDLAVEVEVSHPFIPKLPIYQALGVPEVWCWRKDALTIVTLDANRLYVEREDSLGLPGFPLRLAEDLIRERERESTTALMRRIRTAIAKLPRQ
jgi:Uma2 family endonuclease